MSLGRGVVARQKTNARPTLDFFLWFQVCGPTHRIRFSRVWTRKLVKHVHVRLQPRVESLQLTANCSTANFLRSVAEASPKGPMHSDAPCVAHVSWTCAWVELRRSGGVGVLGCRQLNISPAPSLPELPLNPPAVPKAKGKIATATSRG